jgi:hypothetical protein
MDREGWMRGWIWMGGWIWRDMDGWMDVYGWVSECIIFCHIDGGINGWTGLDCSVYQCVYQSINQ